MEQILGFIETYGTPVSVIAACCIVFIGFLKLIGTFNKISNKNTKKFIYYLLNAMLAFGSVAIYFSIYGLDFNEYITFSCTQIGANTLLYSLYENLGFRSLIQILLSWIATWFAKNPENKYVKALQGLGLSSESIKYIQDITKIEVERNKTTPNN